jgi:hypothetical protein
VLAATNAALPRASRPLARLWQAATTLREHRGDGHVAALVAADLDGCEALVWRSSLDLSRDVLQPARGWTDEQWDAAAQRLVARGLLTPDGTATPAASRLHDQIESATDAAAARPWRRLGVAATEELVGLLSPIAAGCYPAMPAANPIGLQPPPWLVEATAG